MTHSVLILNGPNLNMLGSREPDVYGSETLDDLEKLCQARAAEMGLNIDFRQTNSEGELVDWIQTAATDHAAIILNAGAYTHTSIAIADALRACGCPVIEVHLSNIFQREEYRHKSYVSEIAQGVICGFGSKGYELSLEAAKRLIN
ncbi:MAG: type II 3-dehydroquinate dehydratase [Rhodospirillaceae bacterium]|jgi:3-dehydroquinate dehydratase-2|nr:type II 3-dehydroquinate dehydratase [Rhodospirillaceae bacterium]